MVFEDGSSFCFGFSPAVCVWSFSSSLFPLELLETEVHRVKLTVFVLSSVPEDGSLYLLGLRLSLFWSCSFFLPSPLAQPLLSLLIMVCLDGYILSKSGPHGTVFFRLFSHQFSKERGGGGPGVCSGPTDIKRSVWYFEMHHNFFISSE